MAKQNTLLTHLEDELKSLREEGLFNDIHTISSAQGARLIVDDKSVLNFCSNNYLGLSNHERIKRAAIKAIETHGVGPAAVRSIAGTTSWHVALEERLAKFKGAEDVLVLQSGFLANQAVIPILVGEGDLIISDELNHASIIDGVRLTKADRAVYQHCDMASLQGVLEAARHRSTGRKLIITDGVFSMDGDLAPLADIVELAEAHEALVMVDDAHGEGVLGRDGRGIVDHFDLQGRVDVEVGTLSKAFGVVGGILAGKKGLIGFLRQRARPFLFSSAMTVPDAAACLAAVELLEESGQLVRRLWDNTKAFKGKLSEAGFDLGISQTPITPLMLGQEALARDFSKRLFEQGVFAQAITFPTVPKGKARIRLMVSAAHAPEHLDEAVQVICRVGNLLKVI